MPQALLAAAVAIAALLAIDLIVNRGQPGMRRAVLVSAAWVGAGIVFGIAIVVWQGGDAGQEYFAAYLVEKALSVDNIFVFVLIFQYFRVPPMAQHRALVWGILGALVMRGVMIFLGVALVQRFDFILYIFGAFLLVSAWRMFFVKQELKNFGESWIMRCCTWAFPVTPVFHDEHFKAKVNGKWMLTPLALTLIVIETMDIIFAIDSIPAVFAITRDPFIIYTSNICAILGLRSLYFLLAKMIHRFVYLKNGVSIVLAFVGTKMLLRDVFDIPTLLSLGIVVGILGTAIVISMIATERTNSSAQRDSTP